MKTFLLFAGSMAEPATYITTIAVACIIGLLTAAAAVKNMKDGAALAKGSARAAGTINLLWLGVMLIMLLIGGLVDRGSSFLVRDDEPSTREEPLEVIPGTNDYATNDGTGFVVAVDRKGEPTLINVDRVEWTGADGTAVLRTEYECDPYTSPVVWGKDGFFCSVELVAVLPR